MAIPSMIYPVERPAHVVSKSCPNLTALQPEDCQQAANSWGVSDAELIVRLESFLLDPAIRPRQSLQSFAWNQRPVDVSVTVSRFTKKPIAIAGKIMKKLSVFAQKADELQAMSSVSSSFHSDKMSMNTKVQVAIGQHVGSSNSPLLNQLGAWFCGVAAGLGVVVSVPYVIRSLVCRTATNPSTVQRSLLRRSMAAVLYQPFVGHCLNIATCSISINFMMTKNPLLPPVMLGLMATMTTRDFIGRAISLSETNQVAGVAKMVAKRPHFSANLRALNAQVRQVCEKKARHIGVSLAANAMIVLGCITQLVQPSLAGIPLMQGFPYMTQVGLGVYFLGIAMHVVLSVVLFCNQRQFSADARIIQQHERLCMLSDFMADVEGLPLSILNDKPFEIADNLGQAKALRRELILAKATPLMSCSPALQRFLFHTYDGLSQQQKQRVWQQIASQRHAIFDSVDATLSVVEDLRRLPAHVQLPYFFHAMTSHGLRELGRLIGDFVVLKESRRLMAHNQHLAASLSHPLARLVVQLRDLLKWDPGDQSLVHDYLMQLSDQFQLPAADWQSPQLRMVSPKRLEEQMLGVLVG